MTNSPDPDLARLQDALFEAFAVPVPDLAFEAPRSPSQTQTAHAGFLRRHWRPAGAFAGIAAVIGAFLLVPSFGGDGTTVNAQDILERASATASFSREATAYHLVATWGPGSKGSEATEIWYDGDSQVRMSAGDFGTVRDGDDVWMYLTLEGTTRVAHGPASALADSVAQGVTGSTSLAAVLEQYGEGTCQEATIEGNTVVAGREAHVIRVKPSPKSCPDNLKAAAMADYAGDLTLAIDKETYLTLEMTSRDGSGGVSTQYRVTLLETGIQVPRHLFAYEPPAGAIVTEVTSNTEAKSAITGFDIATSGKPTSGEGGTPNEPKAELTKP